jgi:hypothetical protein
LAVEVRRVHLVQTVQTHYFQRLVQLCLAEVAAGILETMPLTLAVLAEVREHLTLLMQEDNQDLEVLAVILAA